MEKPDKRLRLLGSRVRTLRLASGLSQEELAARGQFDRTYISLIERGRRNPTYTNLVRLANALDISLAELIRKIDH